LGGWSTIARKTSPARAGHSFEQAIADAPDAVVPAVDKVEIAIRTDCDISRSPEWRLCCHRAIRGIPPRPVTRNRGDDSSLDFAHAVVLKVRDENHLSIGGNRNGVRIRQRCLGGWYPVAVVPEAARASDRCNHPGSRIHAPHAMAAKLGDVQVAVGVDVHVERIGELCSDGQRIVAATRTCCTRGPVTGYGRDRSGDRTHHADPVVRTVGDVQLELGAGNAYRDHSEPPRVDKRVARLSAIAYSSPDERSDEATR
jgi:hypothetical protein